MKIIEEYLYKIRFIDFPYPSFVIYELNPSKYISSCETENI